MTPLPRGVGAPSSLKNVKPLGVVDASPLCSGTRFTLDLHGLEPATFLLRSSIYPTATLNGAVIPYLFDCHGLVGQSLYITDC